MVSIIIDLRFYAGPIVHKFSPIGLLVLAARPWFDLSGVAPAGIMIIAAIVYAFGKTLWSTTLRVVSEQFRAVLSL